MSGKEECTRAGASDRKLSLGERANGPVDATDLGVPRPEVPCIGFPGMGSARLGTALAATALVASVVSGCSGGDGGKPRAAPTAPPTPIGQLNGAAMAIPRIDFCALVPRVAVREALGTAHWQRDRWGNGDRTDVAGTTDVVAEHGCRWRATTGTAQAGAWVFAGPADRALARGVVRQARGESSCRLTGGPTYGEPSLTQVCQVPGSVRVRHAGLFGATWLTCEVGAPESVAQVTARADAWCVEIANALNTNR